MENNLNHFQLKKDTHIYLGNLYLSFLFFTDWRFAELEKKPDIHKNKNLSTGDK